MFWCARSSDPPYPDAASETPWRPLLPVGRGSLPTGWAGRAESVTLRCRLGHRRKRGHWEPFAQRHRRSCRETSEPRTQKSLHHAAQPGPAVSAAAAWAQVITITIHLESLYTHTSPHYVYFKKLSLKMNCLSFIDRQRQHFWLTLSSSRWVSCFFK